MEKVEKSNDTQGRGNFKNRATSDEKSNTHDYFLFIKDIGNAFSSFQKLEFRQTLEPSSLQRSVRPISIQCILKGYFNGRSSLPGRCSISHELYLTSLFQSNEEKDRSFNRVGCN